MNKQQGIELAFNATGLGWQLAAEDLAYQYVKAMRPSREPFTTEQLRAYCAQNGLPERKGQAFGKIMQTLYRDGVIRKAGYRESINPRAHDRTVQVWESA